MNSREVMTMTRRVMMLLVVLSPSVGEAGYEVEEVAGQALWHELRDQQHSRS